MSAVGVSEPPLQLSPLTLMEIAESDEIPGCGQANRTSALDQPPRCYAREAVAVSETQRSLNMVPAGLATRMPWTWWPSRFWRDGMC